MKIQKLTKHELQNKLKNLKLVTLDADGTLTDGGMYVDNNGNQLRRFAAHDGTGISMIRHAGVKVAIVTTSEEKVFKVRAEALNVDYIITGSFDKGKDIEELCKTIGVSLDDTLHMGDDVNDISGFLRVGFPVTVQNAVDQVRPFCCYITEKDGGFDAVREVCDIIMLAITGKSYGKPYIPDDIIDKLSEY
ncbi:KdsC family phosphatase [Rickettsiales bacterium LUAb2]